MQDIYINACKKITVIKKKNVYLKDIAQISCPNNLEYELGELCIFQIPHNEKQDYLISIIDIIKVIKKAYGEVTINNLGENEILIEYFPKEKKENLFWEWTKVIAICLVIFSGATMAIIAYQSDTSLAKAFTTLNEVFTGEKTDNPKLLTIPYAIGMFVGVTVFYNHIGTKKITNDPTPIQVEISKYEKDVEDAIVDDIHYKERGK